jgi:hypothetical protein
MASGPIGCLMAFRCDESRSAPPLRFACAPREETVGKSAQRMPIRWLDE